MDLEDIQVLLGNPISLLQQLVACQQGLEGRKPITQKSTKKN